MEEKNERVIKLPNVRLSFPVLFTKRAFKAGQAEGYSASFLFAKDNPIAATIKAALLKAATETWGDQGLPTLQGLFRDDRVCLHDGDRKSYEGYAGNYYVKAGNYDKKSSVAARPMLLDRQRKILTTDTGLLYSGCYVNASVGLWVQKDTSGWGKRINANLRGVQFFADGEAFSGGGTASVDEFEGEPEDTKAALDAMGF